MSRGKIDLSISELAAGGSVASSLGQASESVPKKKRPQAPRRIWPPHNFDLSKYEPLKDMGPRQWAQQLEKRRLLHCGLQDSSAEALSVEALNLPLLIADPLAAFDFKLLRDDKRRPAYFQHFVRPLLVRDLDRLAADRLKSMDRDALLDDCLREAFFGGTSLKGHLQVDLTASDALLKNQFDRYLREYRIAAGKPVVNKRRDAQDDSPLRNFRALVGDWIAYGILPYIDLCLWYELGGQKRPSGVEFNQVMTDHDGTYAVDFRTVGQHADDCLDPWLILEFFAISDGGIAADIDRGQSSIKGKRPKSKK